MSAPVPIALFACDRVVHTERTLQALSRNELASASTLTIHCDGPRDDEADDAVEEVRAIARRAEGFAGVRVVTRDEHAGVDTSIIEGVGRMLEEHDRLIVLDDDLITAPWFLPFMNEALDRYADEPRVVSVSGYTSPVPGPLPETYFLPGAHCWGWGTWRRGWALFEPDSAKLLDEVLRRDLVYALDLEGAEPLTQLLARSIESDGDSWVVRWMASAIVNGGLTLYPGGSLVRKAGLGDGLPASVFDTALATRRPRVEQRAPEPDREAMAQVKSHMVRWRRRWSRKEWVYYRVADLLPVAIERALYSARVRRSLRRLTARRIRG